MKFASLTQRFGVWFLLITLLPLLFLGYSLLHIFERELQQSVAGHISAIADKKADQIDLYLNELVRVALIKTQGHTTRMAMGDFKREFARGGEKSAAYRRLDAHYRDYFTRFIKTTDYYDLFLISPQGTVVYSQAHEADFSTNLFDGPYRNTGLGKVARSALSSLESNISEFEYYEPSGAAAAFIAVPILRDGKVDGVLALQIDNRHVFEVLLDKTGLGESGETVVARRENEHSALLMAPLKRDESAALKRKISLVDKERAAPLVHALNGERGSGYAIDYSGHPVLAAWRYLPRMGWGMVTKIDAEEAFAPYYRVRNFALGALVLALCSALLGAIILGRRLIAPVHMLTRGAQALAEGKLNQRIPVGRKDELGQLANSFNAMAENMEFSYQSLERLVNKRTAELHQSVESMRVKDAAIASSINAIAMAGMDGKIFYVNGAFVDLWRLPGPQDAIGHSPLEFWELPEAAKKVMEVLQQEGHWQGPMRALLRNGTHADLQLTAHIVTDEQGLPICMMGSFVDITERNLIEKKLSTSAERLNEAQRIAQVGSWELNLLSGELQWSDEIFRMFEIDKSKFSPTYESFLNAIHPDDRARVNTAYTVSLKTRQPYDIIHRLQMSDGRIKWVQELCESAFATDGTPLVSRGTVQDVTRQVLAETQLRDSEARYHSVVTALSEGIVINAKDGGIVDANEAAQKILGLSLEQMMGRTPIDPLWRAIRENGSPFPGEEHPGAVTLRTGKPQYNVVMGVHKPDGTLTWILINSQPIFQAGETLPASVAASFVDITERKRADQILKNTNAELERRVELRTRLLQAAKDEAERANNSKSVFLSSMSHELRTPLNAILGYSQLMQMDSSLPVSVIENAGEIRRAGDVLLSLMNDILDLSRIESGNAKFELELVPVSEVMKNCHAQNIHAAMSHNVTLHIATSCSAYHAFADKRALMQVINNFISNGIKYNRDGGRVTVSCAEVVKGKVRISVQDTGLGISAKKQAELFQPFNRLGAEMSSVEGTGIGLVIARKLIQSMQGDIGLESNDGVGSTFWVDVPLSEGLPGKLTGTTNEATTEQPRKIPRVLVAEDYAPNRNLLQLQLETIGCVVDLAPNGAVALEMWRKNSYDLILTDIDMPVMNGQDFAIALRDEERVRGWRIPILAITATISGSAAARYQKAGIDDVLGKPLSIDMLRNGLVRWLGDFTSKVAPQPETIKGIPIDENSAHAVLDLHYLYHILGQVNLQQARIMVDIFIKAADESLQALSKKIENATMVAKEMHKQKSSARTVGALRYANLAAALEQHTKDEHYTGIAAALAELRVALQEVAAASANLLESPKDAKSELPTLADMPVMIFNSALVVDDDLVVLQQIGTMLAALGMSVIKTATNGQEASLLLSEEGDGFEVLVCDLSMPQMDGVELIRHLGKTGFTGGLILISGADEKIITTVNKLAVLQGVRVLGQLQKPVSAAQLAILLARADDPPVKKQWQPATGPVVTREAIVAAMEANAFSVWFQPKVDALTLQAVGIEALARWQLADGKFIPPDSFITVAEREGVIGELSRLLVSISLGEAAKLFTAGYPLKVAINLSGTWLNDLNLPDFILSNTVSSGLQASDVILEVTETGVMEDLTTALDVLSRLRLKGFGLSIDDFGIGYSSFEQLGRIPFTEMKLDRSFVSKGVEDASARAILESSMDMAFKLNLSTVAEGVETENDLKLVRSLGCDLVQGYLIAKPMPVKDLIVWLENQVAVKEK